MAASIEEINNLVKVVARLYNISTVAERLAKPSKGKRYKEPFLVIHRYMSYYRLSIVNTDTSESEIFGSANYTKNEFDVFLRALIQGHNYLYRDGKLKKIRGKK